MVHSKLARASALVVSLMATAQAQAQAQAPPPQQDAGYTGTATVTASSAEFFDNYSIRLGLESAGPLQTHLTRRFLQQGTGTVEHPLPELRLQSLDLLIEALKALIHLAGLQRCC